VDLHKKTVQLKCILEQVYIKYKIQPNC